VDDKFAEVAIGGQGATTKFWHGNQGGFQLCLVSEFWYFTLCKIGPLSLVQEPIGSWFKNIGFEH
jgi:hypothetical protein